MSTKGPTADWQVLDSDHGIAAVRRIRFRCLFADLDLQHGSQASGNRSRYPPALEQVRLILPTNQRELLDLIFAAQMIAPEYPTPDGVFALGASAPIHREIVSLPLSTNPSPGSCCRKTGVPWRSLEVLAAACGGCGTQPTASDIRYFAEQSSSDPREDQTVLQQDITSLGFAMLANGEGRKIDVAVLGQRRAR